MNMRDLLHYRLHQQQISRQQFSKPEEVVKWMGAMQAQDYAGCKWAVGLRVPGATHAQIEKAIDTGKIIRTWSFRGTWQLMAPEDTRWILELLQPRMVTLYGSNFKRLGVDAAVIKKSRGVLERILRDGKAMTRNEIRIALEAKGIATGELRLAFILLRAALDRLICQGPMQGKAFTFVLMDDWVRKSKKLQREEALAELVLRYFVSHGPATVADAAWWSGLTQADVKVGIAAAGKGLEFGVWGGKTYYFAAGMDAVKKTSAVYLLPPFDEYLVAYKDRSDAVEDEYVRKVMGAGNGIFSPVVVVKGKVVGTWKREFQKDGVKVTVTNFVGQDDLVIRRIATAEKRFVQFYRD
jgi:hypothetical protein